MPISVSLNNINTPRDTSKKLKNLPKNYSTNRKILPNLLGGFDPETTKLANPLNPRELITLKLARKMQADGIWPENTYIPDQIWEMGRHANDIQVTLDALITNEKKTYASSDALNRNNEGWSLLQQNNLNADAAGKLVDYLTYGLIGAGASPYIIAPAITSGVAPWIGRQVLNMGKSLVAQKASKAALNNTNLSEDTKNTISGGIGFGFGFGSGQLLPRIGKGIVDYTMFDKVYMPIAENIVGDRQYSQYITPVVAGGLNGIGRAAFTGIEQEGLRALNNIFQKSGVSNDIKLKAYQLLGNISDKVGNERILASIPTNLSEVLILPISGTVSAIEHGIKGAGESILPTLAINGLDYGFENIEPLLRLNEIDPELAGAIKTGIMVGGSKYMHLKRQQSALRDNSGRRYLHLATEGLSGLWNPIKTVFTGKYKNYDGTYSTAENHVAMGGGKNAKAKSHGVGILNNVYYGETPTIERNGLLLHGVLREGWIVPENAGIEYDAYKLNQKLWGGKTPERRLPGQKWSLLSPMDKQSYQNALRGALTQDFKGVKQGDVIIGVTNGINSNGQPVYNYYNGRGHLGSKDYYADKGGSGSGARFEGDVSKGKALLQTFMQGFTARPLDYGAELQPLFFSKVESIKVGTPSNNGMNVRAIGAENNRINAFSPEQVQAQKQKYYNNYNLETSSEGLTQYNLNLLELLNLNGVRGRLASKKRKYLKSKIRDHDLRLQNKDFIDNL